MKKILRFFDELKKWFILTFLDTRIGKVEFDAFVVTFRRFTMEIKTKSGNFTLKTMAMIHPNAQLYHCLNAGDKDTVYWFCSRIYILFTMLTTDTGFANDIEKAITKYGKRLDKKSEQNAQAVTEEEDKAEHNAIESDIQHAKMSKRERKQYKKALREEIRNMANENTNEDDKI